MGTLPSGEQTPGPFQSCGKVQMVKKAMVLGEGPWFW